MKITAIQIVFMFMASALISPMGLSFAESNATSTNSTGNMSNQTITNQTTQNPVPTLYNTTNQATSTTPTVNDTKAVQEISDFIHKAIVDFKQQGDETRQVMFDCRDKSQTASPSDIDQIKRDCGINLNAIKAKYQDERSHFHNLVKQYRSSVMVFIQDARGLQVAKSEMDNAFATLGNMMHPAMVNETVGHPVGLMATKNNTHCVNPPGGPAIC